VNVASFLTRTASIFPDRPAISLGERVWATYRQLARRTVCLSAAFREVLHLVAGDRVAVAMRNSPEYLEILYACWHTGLAAVPINAKLHAREFEFILAHSGARVCFVTADLAETIGPLKDSVPTLERVIVTGSREYENLLAHAGSSSSFASAPEDVVWLFYTSGTTGRPKGVMITHRNVLCMSLCYFANVDAIAPGDCILHAAPMSHGSGIYNFPHVLAGANQVMPESGYFDPAEIFALAQHWGGTTMFAAPTMVHRLMAHAERDRPALDGIKTIVYGGGPMYLQDIKSALRVIGPRFVQIYGQGESPMTITALSRFHIQDHAHPRHEARLASVGVAQAAMEVIVADQSDAPLPAGEIGEILVRGEAVMKGYWQDPDATAETLRNGWLHTGDVGAMDEDGFLTLHDRSKDLIISGGANIYPREVEEVLLRHPGVAEVSVVGQRHDEWGEQVVAFIVPRTGHAPDEAELEQLCLAHIARFKRPRAYRFLAELPKNHYGKVLKTELRRLLPVGSEE
jgi:long-chain acyl-CoA synthetase